MRILVRATNWLGDAVMSLPALQALRTRFPEAHISVLARAWVGDLYAAEPFCDEMIPCPVFRGLGGVAGRLRLARELRRRAFDLALLLPNSFESALTPWLAGIPRRIGYNRDARGRLLTDAIPPPKTGIIPPHESYYYLELLRRAGWLDSLPASPQIALAGLCEARRRGSRLFAQMDFHGPVVGVSPGAQNSRAKRWPADRFAEAARQLAGELGAATAIFGSAQEKPLAQSVAETLRRLGCRVLNLAGQTSLAQFIDLAAACRVFLTNDAGGMHVAAALGVPTVAVFGPTDYIATAPVGPRAVIVREPVECSPCMLRDCPIDHRCMTRIPPERVARAALDLLK